jgi:nucleoside-triphosphatase
MELFSQKFIEALNQALESKKVVLAVVHAKAQDRLISEVKQRGDAELFTVTLANRDSLSIELSNQALSVV